MLELALLRGAGRDRDEPRHDGRMGDESELYAAFDELTAALSPAERRDVFAVTADRFYRIGASLPAE